ncbi:MULTISPECIES: glycoside hydrolase family 3 protein [unclassified Asaia]|uniref:beta-glucosidase n=1 Tax=unclassified Asaia TaxID=2685023 RepID=UPI0013154E66|nr:glycoside hydrolase family 3 protein [Asaia sp. W19]
MDSHSSSRHPLWLNPARTPDERARAATAAMDEAQKLSWMSGPMAIPVGGEAKPEGAIGSAGYFPAMPALGIPAQQQSDASLGIGNLENVRPGDTATALPSSLMLGASFDSDLARETGRIVGAEGHAKGFNVVLGGGANLLREPRGGRIFEYVSEDPLLTGRIVGGSIAGIQSQHVVSTIKHYAINPEETGRVMVSSDIGEAALRESDLLAFEMAIEIGKPGAIMPGYNLVNGEWASENRFLLSEVLRRDWGYQGWVMSDWGATHSTVKAVLAGLDVQSGANIDPAPYFGAPLAEAVATGRVSAARLDQSMYRQLRSLFAVGAVDYPAMPGGAIDYAAHKRIAQRAAEGGIVLLRNEGALLPLGQGPQHILLVGAHADQGVLSGGGSSCVTPEGSLKMDGASFAGLSLEKVYHPSSPLKAIAAVAPRAVVTYDDGRDLDRVLPLAAKADTVIIFAELWRSEGEDVQGLSLPDGQEALITRIAAHNPRVIVVLETGGPVLMPWRESVPAILHAFYAGSCGGEAIAALLFGHVSPSGRLPFTIPLSEEDLPRSAQIDPQTVVSNPGQLVDRPVVHRDYGIEGADIGYRWFSRIKRPVAYPFGHGLSYTRFAHSDFALDRETLTVSLCVTNTGRVHGAEVVQIYALREDEPAFQPRLVGFGKIMLKAGASGLVTVPLEPRLLARVEGVSWRRASGTYRFEIRRDALTPILGESIFLPEWEQSLRHETPID